MMIRLREGAHTSTVLLIRVSWDAARKRSAQIVLGSFQSHLQQLPDDLAGPESPLTDAEKQQVKMWISDRAEQTKVRSLFSLGSKIVATGNQLSEALEDPIFASAALSDLDHQAVYDMIDRLGKVLRKHKLTRPARNQKEALAVE